MTKLIIAICFLALTGCVSTGTGKYDRVPLAAIPSDIRVCFDKLVPAPVGNQLTKMDVIKLIGKLKQSELSKSLCGKRLIKFYEGQR